MDPPDSASRVFCGCFLSMVNTDDVNAIILAQKNMTLKGKLARQHLEAFSHIPEGSFLEDEDEDPIPPSITTTIATSEQSTGSCDTSPDTVSPSLSPGFEDLSHMQTGSPAINGHSQTDDEEEMHGE
ncbi:kxDL motif-containing protein 1-like [Psammomys obesus]|uniref:kxDL motif-containing protein 1-like n=1 Tax=Psammomys obesus TaxID=48139 RepID=UPI0024535441|nr:kxDL motif-containing protein 1-like [Psammomys obesus]